MRSPRWCEHSAGTASSSRQNSAIRCKRDSAWESPRPSLFLYLSSSGIELTKVQHPAVGIIDRQIKVIRPPFGAANIFRIEGRQRFRMIITEIPVPVLHLRKERVRAIGFRQVHTGRSGLATFGRLSQRTGSCTHGQNPLPVRASRQTPYTDTALRRVPRLSAVRS